MKACAIVSHLDVYGGVRRYFEIGNEFVRQGHEFTLFYKRLQREKKPWMPYKGNLKELGSPWNGEFDLAFTGANDCFGHLDAIKAKVKVVMVVAKFYSKSYEELWRKKGNEYLWIGVAEGWDNHFDESIKGTKCVGGVNLNFFKPDKKQQGEDFVAGVFGRKEGERRGYLTFYDMLTKNMEWRDTVGVGGKMKFVVYDWDGDYSTIQPGEFGPFVEVVKIKSQEQLLKLLQSFKVIMSFMESAGWNNVIAEGMACGAVPVATTAGTEDQIRDGVTGWHCKSSSDFIDALRYLKARPLELDRMSKNSMSWIKQYGWDNFVKKLCEEWKKKLA